VDPHDKRDKVDKVAARIADGTDIDWVSAESTSFSSHDRALLDQLRTIADVATLHRAPDEWSAEGEQGTLANWGALSILSSVGAGRFGEVFLAWDARLQRRVALKLLHAASPSLASPTRAIEEARLLARVRHPNVLAVYGAEYLSDRVGIWTEFIEGRTLEAILAERGPLPVDEVIAIGIDLCRALAAVHDAGLVHRDVKAQNVMRETGGRIVLMDFGTGYELARATPREGDLSGTPLYLAPELFRGASPSAATDVYAVGVLLFRLLTGHYPVPGLTLEEVRAEHAAQAAVSLRSLRPHTPGPMARTIERALAQDPKQRFQSAREFERKLTPPSSFERVIQTITAHKVVALSAVVLLVLAAGATIRVLGVSAVLDLTFLRRPGKTVSSLHVVPLTTLPGVQDSPSLSPDGLQVAFTWRKEWNSVERNGVGHVYIVTVGSPDPRRLASGLANDFSPSWSPDGQNVAFIGIGAAHDAPCIHIVSPDGGHDQRLCAFPAGLQPGSLGWSPDSRFIVAGLEPPDWNGTRERARIYLVDVAGGESRLLTSTRESADYFQPALSPDGKYLAFVSCKGVWDCGVSVVQLDSTLHQIGDPRELIHVFAGVVNGVAWTHDSREVIYGTETVSWPMMRVWRVPVDGSRRPDAVEIAGANATSPAVASGSDRLAVVTIDRTRGIYQFMAGHDPVPLWVSSFLDGEPSLSPDGTRLTFSSGRSGDGRGIWIADLDGSNAHQLTPRQPGQYQGSPSWSSDGRRIVYDEKAANGEWHIWTIDQDGGIPQQLRTLAGNANGPSWSNDGRWVYYTVGGHTNTSGVSDEIWRIPATGGTSALVLRGAGGFAHEAPDGQSLLFMPRFADVPLMIAPLIGGRSRVLAPCVLGRMVAVGRTDVYYVCESGGRQTLHRVNPSTGNDQILGTIAHVGPSSTLTVSPDEQTILYAAGEDRGANLMLIEGFR
jgi:Tol biopolymer transport system component/serine/threonine protein kinase